MKEKNSTVKKIIAILFLVLLMVGLIIAGKRDNYGKEDTITYQGFFFDTIINIEIFDVENPQNISADSQNNQLNHDLIKEKTTKTDAFISPWKGSRSKQEKVKKEELIDKIENACYRYENLFSKTVEKSDIWKINKYAGQWVEVNPETVEIIENAIKYCELSNGALDITISPVVDIWNGKVPSEEEIDSALQKVNYRSVELMTDRVKIPEGAGIDLGAVAKGYIADRLSELLVENGVTSAIINLGGNTACIGEKTITSGIFGRNKEKKPFVVGIQKPFSNSGQVIDKTEVVNESLVTSGTYQRYFEENGKIYHHILSSEDGWPVDNGLTSVSIRTRSSFEADCLSTACFCLGLDEGMKLIERLPGTEAIFIDENEEIFTSSGW